MASTSTSPAESWCRKSSLTLIRCYKNHPCLYDSLHPHYLKRDKKEEAYRQIVEKVEAVRPNVTIADVRKRIKTLLGQLHKEKNKHRRTASKGDVYRPKLWCYKELKFLINRNVQSNKSSTNIPGPLLGMKGQSRVEDTTDSLLAEVPTKDNSTKRQRLDSLEEAALATLKAAENAEQNATAQRHQLTPVEAFCQYLCAEMRQLSLQTFNKLKIDMMEMLNDAIVKDQQPDTWHKVTDAVPSTSVSTSTISAPIYEISGGSMPFKKIKLQKIAIIQPPSGEATYFQL